MRFDDVWMSGWQLDKLCKLAIGSSQVGEAIEIGAHQGLSAIPIANALFPSRLHVVDHWEGSTDFKPEHLARDNYKIFMSNIEEGTLGNIEVHKQDWREFARVWTAPIRFLHLDAEHTKTEVSAQIETFLPYMVSGSVLAGDDYDWPGVWSAIAEHFQPGKVNVLNRKLWWVEFE